MVGRSGIRVFVLTREQGLRRLLEDLLQRSNNSVRCFSTPQDCLRELSAGRCEFLIIDGNGCPTDELGVVVRARPTPLEIPAIILIDAGDVPKAVLAMKLGACDCFEKPVREDLLLAALEGAWTRRRQGAVARPEFTRTEARVLQLILAGKTTGEMAGVLHRSGRTVEVHRRNILRKLKVRGTAGLVKWAVASGVIRATGSGLPPG
jgi:two-component system response regulator FixJ